MKKPAKPTLTLSKTTLKALSVKTAVRAGLEPKFTYFGCGGPR